MMDSSGMIKITSAATSHASMSLPSASEDILLEQISDDFTTTSEKGLRGMTSSPGMTTADVTNFWNMSMEQTSVSMMDIEQFLQKKNDEFSRLVLPAMIILAVLFVIGVIGNSMVLYVYNRKFHKGTIRWFVQALAIFDLLSCLVAIPGEIIDMRNNYTFGSSPMCKVVRTVSMFCTVASGMTLMVVAVERYKRICTPLKKQITPKGAQVIITVCTVMASIFAAPACVVYGHQAITTEHPGIKGSDCSTADVFIDTFIPLLYSSFQCLLFLLGALGLVVLYSLIGHKVWSHARFRRVGFSAGINKRMSFLFSGSECSSPTTDDMVFAFPAKKTIVQEDNSNTSHGNDPADNNNDQIEAIESPAGGSPTDDRKTPAWEKNVNGTANGKGIHSDQDTKNHSETKAKTTHLVVPNGKTGNQRDSLSQPPTPTNDLTKAFDTFKRAKLGSRPNSNRDPRHKAGDFSGLKGRYQRRSTQQTQSDIRRFLHRSESVNSGTRRTTLMLFLITLVYLLSFLPYLILMVVKVLDEESLSGRGGGWELAHNILLRSYFINSMANPIIYSFCSRTFRTECSKVLHCRCCKSPMTVR